MKYRLNPDGTFMSAEQIADDVVMQLRATKAASEFAGSDSDGPDGIELIRRDFDVGETPFSAFAKSEFLRSIRNTYGMWDAANPHATLNPPPNSANVIDDPAFPDNLSATVFELIRERLK